MCWRRAKARPPRSQAVAPGVPGVTSGSIMESEDEKRSGTVMWLRAGLSEECRGDGEGPLGVAPGEGRAW